MNFRGEYKVNVKVSLDEISEKYAALVSAESLANSIKACSLQKCPGQSKLSNKDANNALHGTAKKRRP